MKVFRRHVRKTSGSIVSSAGRAVAAMVERLESRTLMAAAPPTLVRDPSAASSFVEVGDRAFFIESGASLHVTNGTAGGTFALKTFGKAGGMTAVGGHVYLAADSGVWRSDGTPAGTVHVLPMYNNIGGVAHANGFTELGGEVYFYARVQDGADGGWRYGLWKTDGTPGGTTMVRGIHSAESLTRVGDTLFFIGDDEQGAGKELWASDGTAGGTALVKDLNPGPTGSMSGVAGSQPMAALGDKLLFMASDGTSSHYNIFVSDGTSAGTTRLSAAPRVYGALTSFNNDVYFSATDAGQNQEIWKSNGTVAGTQLVKELGPNQATGFANRLGQLTNVGGALFFAARNGDSSANLWKTNGTESGTVVVKGAATGTPFRDLFSLTNVDGTLAFTVSDPAVTSGAYALWTSDGTTLGTVKVRDTFTGGVPGAPGNVGAAGSVALFTANDGAGAAELWGFQTATPPPVPQAVADGLSPYAVAEGGTLSLHGYTTAEPLPGRPLTYAWDLDNDGVYGETGAAALRGNEAGTDPAFNATGLDGPSAHVVRFRISDGTGYTSTDTADVAIRNAAPTLNVTGGPTVLVQGNAYTLTLSSADHGPDAIIEWVIDWGDGTTQTLPGGATSVTHAYPDIPRTYGIIVKARDEDGEYRSDRAAALDAGFGSGGVVALDDRSPRDVVVQPDGKILSVSGATIARYNPDGTPDVTFGIGGRAQLQAEPAQAAYGAAIALHADGRIVVSGSVGTDVGADALVLRLLPDGSPDFTFGRAGRGYVRYNLGTYEVLSKLAIAPDGDIVAAGIASQKLILARMNPDGSPDAGFDAGGTLVTDIAANAGGVRDMAVQPDGKILLVPYGYPPTPNFLVMRFNADGSSDASFDGDGRVAVDFEYGPGVATSLALRPDGTILVAGSAPSSPNSPQPGGNDAVVARLTATGALDATFADGGRLRTVPAGPFDSSEPLQGMALPIIRVLPDDGFLLGGSHQLYLNRWQYLVDRYHADGTTDTSFAPGGRFTIDLGGTGIDALLRGMAVRADGAPLLFGGAGTAHDPSGAIIRLTPPGLSVRVVDAAGPQVSISAPATASEAATYTLGLGATDPDGDGIAHWIINWGDGSVQVVAGNPSSVTHVYADGPRAVVIKASAIDGDRSIASVSADVNVANVPPTITVTGGAPAAEGSPYTVQFSATDPGPDTITHWTINWGDGKTSSVPAGATSAEHAYLDDGAYSVVVTAHDEDGAFPAAPVTASITNVPPTLDPLGDRRAAAGAGFALTFTARDVVPEVFGGTIDWGDGTQPTPFSGSAATPLAVHNFAVGHTYAARGTYVVTVNLSDGDGGAATATASVAVGDLAARVFNDVNGNGLRDSGELPRVGATAFLDLDRDAALDAGEPTATTDSFGDALFDGVPAGTHAARVVVPANWRVSTPAAGFVDATPGTSSALATFGLSQAAAATGTLWDDANANGVRDASEGTFTGTVRARRTDTGTAVTVFANNGAYRFGGLLPGQYVIELTSSTRVTTAPGGRRGHLITVTGAEAEFAGLDIGSFAGTGGTLAGTMYRDLNGNGVLDPGEPGVSNQVVYIDANDDGRRDPDELTGLTGSTGGWAIARLPAGTYRVRQILPPGSPAANDPAASRQVTVALAQTVSGINLARPFERTYYIRRTGDAVVVYNGSEPGQSIVSSTPVTSTSPLAVPLGAGDDWVIIDWSAGSPIPAGGLHIDGLGGAGDVLTVIGTPAADEVTFDAGRLSLGDASLSHAGIERITYDGNGGTDDVTITGGPAVVLAGAQDVAPRVSGLFVSGTTWTSGFLNFVASSGAGDAALGYRLDAAAHADELPWTNLNRVSVRFTEHVTLAAGAMRLFGRSVAEYAASFAYDADTFTATWTLASGSFAADKLLLLLDDALVADASGNALDGEWTNPAAPATGGADAFPSGDGTAGGDFRFRINVLPGDADRTGGVTGADVALVRSAQGGTPGFGLYSVFKDLDGSGGIVGADVALARSRQGSTLPAGEPVAPVADAQPVLTARMTSRDTLFASGSSAGSAIRRLGQEYDLLGDALETPLVA